MCFIEPVQSSSRLHCTDWEALVSFFLCCRFMAPRFSSLELGTDLSKNALAFPRESSLLGLDACEDMPSWPTFTRALVACQIFLTLQEKALNWVVSRISRPDLSSSALFHKNHEILLMNLPLAFRSIEFLESKLEA